MPEEEKVAKPEPDPEEEKPQFDKRIPYTVIRSSRLSKPNDVRYIVVNLNDKDQVLDDASGYGYKSISAAQKGYGYKCRNLTKYGEIKHSSKPKTNIPVSQYKNTRTSHAKQVQQTSMQAALDAERDVLLQAARHNASRYSEAEDATKDFVIE